MDMKKKLLFVFNPCSGKAQIKNQLLDIVDTMVKADYEVTIYPTQCAGDAKEKVEAYAGNYDLVVCSGGDGTLDEVVTGMMQCKAKVPLGYIPAGSTNDFASSLGIPKDMEKAAEAAVTGKPFPCDVGLFNGDYFVYVAAFGLFTEVSYKTSQEWKNVLGHAAYILEGAKCLHDIPSFMMQVEYNNMRIQDEFIYGMITNSTSVGGFIRELKELGVEKTVMLTGDRREVGEDVAHKLGLDECRAELLPTDKVSHVEQLLMTKPAGKTLAYVGDGINDAPVLKRADVGIAMGGLGSDAAIEAADVVLMDDDPRKIALAVKIARRTIHIAHENVIFAIGVKVAVLILATIGLGTMWMAVFADVGVTVLAVLNAMRSLGKNRLFYR